MARNKVTDGDFSDESEFYRAWREDTKRRKHQRLEAFDANSVAMLQRHPAVTNVEMKTEYQCNIIAAGCTIAYYPSTRRWVFNNRSRTGSFAQLLLFLDALYVGMRK